MKIVGFKYIMVFFLLTAFVYGQIPLGNINFTNSYEIAKVIKSSRDKFQRANENSKEYYKERLFQLYRRAVEENSENKKLIRSFIEDDLKYGDGRYAVHLLQYLNDSESNLRLMELNMDENFVGRTIAIRPFLYSPVRNREMIISGENIYQFSRDNARKLFRRIDKNKLPFSRLLKFGDLSNEIFKDQQPPTPRRRAKSQKAAVQVKHEKKEEKQESPKAVKKTLATPVKEFIPEREIREKKITKKTVSDKMISQPEKKVSLQKQKRAIHLRPPVDNRYFWEVIKTEGTVKAKDENSTVWKLLEKGSKIFEGEVLKTGDNSSVVLRISGLSNDESFSQLFSNTELKVVKLSADILGELDDVYIDLVLGEVLVNIEDISETADFAINTPTAVAGVRGTLFGVKVFNSLNSEISLFRGSLKVKQRSARGNRDVILYSGEKIINDYFKAMPPVKLSQEKKDEKFKNSEENIKQVKEAAEKRRSERGDDDRYIEDPGGGDGFGRDRDDFDYDEEDEYTSDEDHLYEEGKKRPLSDEELLRKEQLEDELRQKEQQQQEFEEKKIREQQLNDPSPQVNFISDFADPTSPMNPSFDPTLDPGNYLDGEYVGPDEDSTTTVTSPTVIITPVYTPPPGGTTQDPPPPSPPPPPGATTIYVDSINGLDSNDGTEATPVKTITKAIALSVSTGLKIIALAENGAADSYGTSNGEAFPVALPNGIQMGPYPGAASAAVIEGDTATVLTVSGGNEVFLKDIDFTGVSADTVAIEADASTVNLTRVNIRNCKNAVVLNNDSHLKMTDGEIRFCGSSTILVPFGSLDLNGVLFADNTLTSILNPPGATPVKGVINNCEFTTSGVGGQISLEGDTTAPGATLTFSNCQFYNNAGTFNVVFSSSGPNMVLIFDNCQFYNNSTAGKIIFKQNSPSLGGGLDVNRCTFYSNTSPEIVQGAFTNLRVFNSLFYNNTGTTVVHGDNAGSGSSAVDGNETVQIVHNTFDQNNSSYADIQISGSDFAAIKNNAFSATANYFIGGGGLQDFDYNVFEFDGSTMVMGIADITALNAGSDCTDNDFGPPVYKDAYPAGSVDYTPSSIGPSSFLDACADLNGVYGSGHLNTDLKGNPRPYGNSDAGCLENQGGDPLVHGIVTDSLSGQPVEGAVVSIYSQSSSVPLQRSTGSSFAFDMDPGNYFLHVQGAGISFPSSRKAEIVNGDHGGLFTVIDGIDMNINIPVDVTPSLTVIKKSNKSHAVIGEVVTFGIELVNPYWQQTIDDINVYDSLPKGFKYISGSMRYNNSAMSDPTIDKGKLTFNAGSIPASTKKIFTYQAVVSTGAEAGEKHSALLARNSNYEIISNIAENSLFIDKDTLFSSATLLGRVFEDANGSGYYDFGEKTFPDIELVSEYGLKIYSGKEGFFHIKDMQAGRHVLKAVPSSLPQGFKSANLSGIMFDITEGSLKNIAYPLVRGYDNSDFFFVGLGELSVSDNKVSGSMELLSENDNFDEGFDLSGRGAFYLRGKILGKYLIEASYDSERNNKINKSERSSRLLTNLNPDKYYPVYGDSSKRDYRATETSDDLYLMISWENISGNWSAKWGSLQIDWPAYRRVMHGGKIRFVSNEKDLLDKAKISAEVFYGVQDNLAAHEEFIGTGMSVYRLKNRNIIEGSEQLKVVMKNHLSELIVKERVLIEEIDYVINYSTGIITLKRPLSSTVRGSNESIVSNDVLKGLQSLLVADYEYENTSIDNMGSYGAKIAKTFNQTRLSLSYAEDEKDEDPYRIAEFSAVYMPDEKSNISFNYRYSEETFSEGATSYDGGVKFSGTNQRSKNGLDGTSWDISANSLLFTDHLKLEGSYSKTEAGFSAREHFSSADAESSYLSAKYLLTDKISFGVDYQKSETESEEPSARARAVTDYLERTIFHSAYVGEKFELKAEYVQQETGRPYQGELYLGALPPLGDELAALKVAWNPQPGYSYYAISQMTVKKDSLSGESNDMNTLGVVFPLFKKADISVEARSGDIGDSVSLGLNLHEKNDEQSYIGFETGNHHEDGKFQTLSFSKSYLSEKGATYRFVKDYSYFNARTMEGDLFSIELPLMDWTFGLSVESASIEERANTEAINRDSISLRYNYLNKGLIRFSGKIEWRTDDYQESAIENNFYYLEDQLHMLLSENSELFVKAVLELAEENESSDELVDYKKFTAGISYRPHGEKQLNLLGKIDYVESQPFAERESFYESTLSEKIIFSLAAEQRFFNYLSISGKAAWRRMDEQTGNRSSIDSDTYLFITALSYDLFDNLSLSLEYRILENADFDDRKHGYLLQSIFELSDWINLIGGYNFTSFDDDLSNSDEYDARGWFVRLSTYY